MVCAQQTWKPSSVHTTAQSAFRSPGKLGVNQLWLISAHLWVADSSNQNQLLVYLSCQASNVGGRKKLKYFS